MQPESSNACVDFPRSNNPDPEASQRGCPITASEIEIITDGDRRRRWTAAEKLRIVEETLDDRASISVVARRNGVAPNLLYRWRRLMLEGGSVAVSEDDDVISNKVVRQLEDRVRELERQLGRKTLEAETVLGLIGGWIEDYNDNHPHSGLKMRSPREFIAAQTATA